MERSVIVTKDGSHSISVPEINVTYHSMHGAIRESLHVFIEAGLKNISPYAPARLHIFEMGLGTGLNALLTFMEAEKIQQSVHYTAIELFPLDKQKTHSLNYCRLLERPGLQTVFDQLHECEWETDIAISPLFTFHKIKNDFTRLHDRQGGFSAHQSFHLIYYDAFAPADQPELWTQEIFETLYSMMCDGGVLITYCSKADVRRAMQATGFKTEKIPGPPGKREILRARKKSAL